VFKWLDDYDGEVECLIYFTDGWGDQDEIDSKSIIDTVWVTTDKEEFPFGEVVKFEGDM
jgi:predicted metal-dependent peptidase